MTLKSYFWGLRISALATFAAWVLVINFIDPEKAGISGQALFYLSTFLLFSALTILFFSWLRKKANGEQALIGYLGISFRQGILIALLTICLLLMQQLRVLTWWDSALTVAAVLLVELYFLTRE